MSKISKATDLLSRNRFGMDYQEYKDLKLDPKLVEKYKDRYDIKTDVAPACIACQIGHIEKYKDDVVGNPWNVECKFIPKSYDIPKKLRPQFSQKQRDMLRIVRDPVEWARYYLGWQARPYQETTLRCTAKHTVHRWGRRSGKTEQCAVEILWFTLTNQIEVGTDFDGNKITTGPRTMIVTPYLSQIQLVFEKIQSLINRNDDIRDSVTRFVKTPFYRMEFSNGGTIVGFTTGSKSKGEGAVLRGQGAHKIYLDECDYMDEGDYKAILPILYEDAERSIIASSTPTGKREKFYEWCKARPHWKEFYFPSTVLPHWDEIEDEVLLDTSQAELLQEYMADFIALDIGVYQPNYINSARTTPPYVYADRAEVQGMVYSMGIDWGSSAGTEIVVTGLDQTHHIWVVDAMNVPHQGWTQLAAMEAVLEMNKKWKPKFIYADYGFGATNIELLQRYSLQMRKSNPGDAACDIYDNLHAYDFGSKIEVRDPNSGQIVKKPAKDFMVQNSVRRFEEGTVHIPQDEETLYKQLLNYIVERVNQAGMRIYGQSNVKVGDHRLDAFNLALVAYKLEMSEFSLGSGGVVKVLYAGMPGENYKERKNKEVNPFAADIKYPKDYMKYNVDERPVHKDKPRSRELKKDDKSRSIFPGSSMKEMRPGFMSDTEHMHEKKATMRSSRRKGGLSTGRGGLGSPKKRF